jgi:hypothetical protein
MLEEESLDAESGTLNKGSTALEHLRHLIKIGWKKDSPLIQNFISKYNLEEDLDEILKSQH